LLASISIIPRQLCNRSKTTLSTERELGTNLTDNLGRVYLPNLFVKKHYSALQVLFAPGLAEIIRVLFSPRHKRHYVRELMGETGLSLSTVQHGLRKLSALQLVTSWSNRYHRFYQANRDHALFRAIVHIVQTTERMPKVARSHLHRDRRRRPQKNPPQLPPDRPMSWHLFSERKLDR
jgi:hypothetical protein